MLQNLRPKKPVIPINGRNLRAKPIQSGTTTPPTQQNPAPPGDSSHTLGMTREGSEKQTIPLLSTSVGTPAFLGMRRGEEVISGICKQPLEVADINVSTLNIDGDGQADLVNHGGIDKAVYCYPMQHLAHWRDTLGYTGDGIHAPMGENLLISDIDETTACIGDIWRWGDVVLQISQPRWPCYKLDMLSGIKGMMTKLIKSGYSGWYFRVLESGAAPISGEIEVIERDPLGITVLDAFNARRDPTMPPEEYARIMSHPRLAPAWSR